MKYFKILIATFVLTMFSSSLFASPKIIHFTTPTEALANCPNPVSGLTYKKLGPNVQAGYITGQNKQTGKAFKSNKPALQPKNMTNGIVQNASWDREYIYKVLSYGYQYANHVVCYYKYKAALTNHTRYLILQTSA